MGAKVIAAKCAGRVARMGFEYAMREIVPAAERELRNYMIRKTVEKTAKQAVKISNK